MGLYGVLALVAFMALIVWRSFQIGGVRCEVCITYNGGSQCRAVDGTNRAEGADDVLHVEQRRHSSTISRLLPSSPWGRRTTSARMISPMMISRR